MIPELGRSRLAQPAEVSNKILVVLLRVDIEVIPQVTPDGHTAETIFAHLLNVLKRHTTLGHHMAVYDALPCGSQQFVGVKEALFSLSEMLSKMLRSKMYSHCDLCSLRLCKS